uniref:RING-type E3 ubiquitin transferase n=1 Tax=Moschus moschiferus TaxID=68415 RepID=A0A8C6DZN0_MOSMO
MESSDSDYEGDRVSVQHRDYILMRNNNLLGCPGESKEKPPQNSDENTDRGDASHNGSSDDSLLDCLNTFAQAENETREQKENQSWREESQISANSDELRFGLERNLECDDENSNPEKDYVASAKLPRREDTEDSQRQVENLQPESLFTTPSASEQDTKETLMEVPPTTSKRRLRSRSPVYLRTRARTDSWSLPHSQWETVQRINEDTPSQTFKQTLIRENERFSRSGHEETSRQQMPGHELQNRGLIETSTTSNPLHGEGYSDTTCSSESWEVRETNANTHFNLEVEAVDCPADSQRDFSVSTTQLTSDSPNNTFSDSDEDNESTYVNAIRNPIQRILNTCLNDTICIPIQITFWQTMTGSSNSSNLMDSDSNLEHSVSPPGENIERAESPNERHGPSGSESRPGSASNATYDPDSSLIVISDLSPYYIASSTSSYILTFSSHDEDSDISSLTFEDSEERSLSTVTLSPPFNLDQFFLLNEEDPHQTTGLTRTQIDNLPLRSFEETEGLKVCTICITEYTAGNTLRVLPCFHEYHDNCIDQWLEENSTCPICRGPVVDPAEADNSM